MLKKKIILSSLFLVMSLLFISCSTIVNGSKDDVTVLSNPENAKIIVNGITHGPTPGIIRLKRGDYHIITIKKDGYAPVTVRTSRSVSGWIVGNIFWGIIIGGAIDFITGSAYDVEPDFISVTLERDTALNQLIEQDNIDGVNLYDEDNTLVGKINFVWE